MEHTRHRQFRQLNNESSFPHKNKESKEGCDYGAYHSRLLNNESSLSHKNKTSKEGCAAQAQRSADHDNALTQEFNKAMTDLVFVAKGTDFPIQGCCMKKMQCIEYNA